VINCFFPTGEINLNPMRIPSSQLFKSQAQKSAI